MLAVLIFCSNLSFSKKTFWMFFFSENAFLFLKEKGLYLKIGDTFYM